MSRQLTGTRPDGFAQPGEAVDRLHQVAVGEPGGSRSGDRLRREQAAERRQAEARLAAREGCERDQQPFPAVVMPVPGGAADGAVAQQADRIALAHRACARPAARPADAAGCGPRPRAGKSADRRGAAAGRRIRAAAARRSRAARAVRHCRDGRQKAVPRLSSAASTPSRRRVARGDALLAAGLAPAFERAIGRRRAGRAEAARVDQQPEGGEIGERLALEDAAQIRLDEGRPVRLALSRTRRSCVAVAAQAPERAVARIEPILHGRGGRASAAVAAADGRSARSRSSDGGTTTTGTRPPRASSVTAIGRSSEHAGADAVQCR